MEEDVDKSSNKQHNVPNSNNVEKQESDNEKATIAGETVGDVDQHTHETETIKTIYLILMSRKNNCYLERMAVWNGLFTHT